MSYLVRKIEKAKWTQNDIFNGEIVSADAITLCSKTKGNSLSVWEIDDISQIETVVIAMVASGDKIDTLDIVCFDREVLCKKGLTIKEEPGNTRYTKMVSSHRDIVGLNYLLLGRYSEIIVDELIRKQDKRFTVREVKTILRGALSNGDISEAELGDDILRKL